MGRADAHKLKAYSCNRAEDRGLDMRIAEWIGRSRAYRRLRREHPEPGVSLASKILYKMAWDRNPQLAVFADKVAVRAYIAERVGDAYVVPVICVAEPGHPIDFSRLPREFAIKVSHGSGGVIVVTEKADPRATLPEDPRVGWARFTIHPDQLDPERINNLLEHWQSLKFEWGPGTNPEWAYRGIAPRVVVEPLMASRDGGPPREYKVFCFNGRAQVIRFDRGLVGSAKAFTHYDRQWSQFDVDFIVGGYRHTRGAVESKPTFLSDLLRVAERLTDDVDFARVDFIDDNGLLRVGEITNYPTAGNFDFSSADFAAWFGKDWLPNYRSVRSS